MHVLFLQHKVKINKQKGKPLLVGMLVLPECLGHDISENCYSQPVIQYKLAVGKIVAVLAVLNSAGNSVPGCFCLYGKHSF